MIKNNTWGGNRPNSGRKPKREELKKMEVYLSTELKQKAVNKAKELNLSHSDYLKSLIEKDLMPNEG
ncbi:MAG: hypothetical protein ACRC1Z_10955 [Waterburya sp.]